MLEEIGYKYNVNTIDLNKGDQFNPEFKKISPFSKIPVIKDQDNNEVIFESGAILIYLAEKSGKYFDDKNIITQWLMAQMGYVGPFLDNIISFIIITLVKVILVSKDISKYQRQFIKIWMKDYQFPSTLQEKIIQ